MTDLQTVCDDLSAEHADLDAVVANLDTTAWRTPTPAAGWTIHDQVLHLALTDHVATLAASDPVGFDAYRQSSREARLADFEWGRELPSGELLALWRQNRSMLLEALRGLDARDRITWFGPPMSALSHATARLMETWAHGQDVLDALSLTRPATSRLRHIVHLGVRTREYSYTQRGLLPPPTGVLVQVRGPADEVWTWGDATAPDSISGSAMDFALVVVQRRHLDDTGLQVRGPHAREWLLIAQAFAGQSGGGRQPGQFRPPESRLT